MNLSHAHKERFWDLSPNLPLSLFLCYFLVSFFLPSCLTKSPKKFSVFCCFSCFKFSDTYPQHFYTRTSPSVDSVFFSLNSEKCLVTGWLKCKNYTILRVSRTFMTGLSTSTKTLNSPYSHSFVAFYRYSFLSYLPLSKVAFPTPS